MDQYHHIYDGEIFKSSQCIWHENTFMDFVRSNLIFLGYRPISESKKVWQRADKIVVCCVADDISTCKINNGSMSYIFDTNTTVITDNRILVPTQYKVINLPASFFGIYSHRPESMHWTPDRRFNFSVNRLDQRRMMLLLEIWFRSKTIDSNAITRDYVNFNCWHWQGQNDTAENLRSNFVSLWTTCKHNKVFTKYQLCYDELVDCMPMKNHNLSHEQSHLQAWCNLVVETYGSDTNIALSEKTFRAISLPVPWLIYGGNHLVAFLKSLGMDILDDIFVHQYDTLTEHNQMHNGDKPVVWVWEAHDAVNKMKQTQVHDWQSLQQRLLNAAEHNQQILSGFRQQWPVDFAAWWPGVLDQIK